MFYVDRIIIIIIFMRWNTFDVWIHEALLYQGKGTISNLWSVDYLIYLHLQ